MITQIYKLKVPTSLVCCIEYGDFNGDYTDTEIQSVHDFWKMCAELQELNKGTSYTLQYSDSHDFGLYEHPFNTIAQAGDVTVTTMTVLK